jgi:uncharacterized membrane protein YjjB (DUF3815 family)
LGEARAAFVMIVGFLIALQAYVRNTSIPERFVGQFGILYRFLLRNGISTRSTTACSFALAVARPLLLEEGR